MRSRICAPPTGPAVVPMTPLTLRRHVDMMRVCSAACSTGAAR